LKVSKRTSTLSSRLSTRKLRQ